MQKTPSYSDHLVDLSTQQLGKMSEVKIDRTYKPDQEEFRSLANTLVMLVTTMANNGTDIDILERYVASSLQITHAGGVAVGLKIPRN